MTKNIKKYRVTINRSKCLACVVCVSLCPEVFSMGPDGKVETKGFKQVGQILTGEIDETQLLPTQQAAQACSEKVITIEKIK